MVKAYVALGCVFVLLGLVMIFATKGFIVALVIAIGVAAIVSGIVSLLAIPNMIDDVNYKRIFIIRAILNIIVGLIAVIIPTIFAGAMWTIIVYVLAVELIISAIIEIYGVIKLHKLGVAAGMYLPEAIISILLAAVLFAIPATIGLVVIKVIGVLVIITGISGIIWSLKTEKEIKNLLE